MVSLLIELCQKMSIQFDGSRVFEPRGQEHPGLMNIIGGDAFIIRI